MGNTSGKVAPRSRNKKTVHWKATDKPSPPGRPQLISGPPHLEPDVVTIQWDKPLNDGGSPIIGYVVEHKRTGSPHWVRAIPGLVGKPQLSISGLEPGWRYQFRVIAHNSVEASDPSELSEPLTVTLQRNIITPPRFTLELQDTTALENEKVEFSVQITGIPVPSVCWYKDGLEIFSSRRTRISTENGQSLLVIHQTSLVDEGEIKCTATNKAGHASCKAFLKVEAPPRIRLPRQYEDGLLFEMDEMIRLKISVAGKPVPEIFWSHNGESIANDRRYEIINADRTSTLKVVHARRSDRGEYNIRAVNKLGEHTASFLVTVTDRPMPPGKVNVMSLGKSVTLTWNAPEDDGGCKIGNYIIEYYRVGWNVWLKAGTSRKLSTTLGELIEGSEYRFRIKAENPYGISEPSEESDTIFIPDPKRGILEPPPKSKVQQDDIAYNIDVIKGPKVQKSSLSVTSSKSSLDSRPTSPISNEPMKPIRGNKMKTPSITPDPSPLTHRKDIQSSIIANNMFDRSSMVRELSYGSPDVPPRNKVIKTTNGVPSSPGVISQSDTFEKSFKETNNIKVNGTRHFNNTMFTNQLNSTQNDDFTSIRKEMTFDEQNPKEHRMLESPNNDDILHGSSEFMLVLLPNSDNSTKNRKGGSASNLALDFSESIAPPISLSAPELGFEPPSLGMLRFAVSSSELLHERAMMRFYEAMQKEQTENISNVKQQLAVENEMDTVSNTSRRSSLGRISDIPGLPMIKIELDETEMLERKHSLRRRLSGSGISQQLLWQRRLSWGKQSAQAQENTPEVKENRNDQDENKIPVQTVKDRIKKGIVRQRSESEEKEEQIFEQVRAKMAKTDQQQEENKKLTEVSKDKDDKEGELVRQQEEMEIDELEEEEEEEDEDIFDDDRPWLEEQIIPEHIEIQEEETYHPKMMIPKTQPAKTDVPFEILNKPSPLPDPNFVPKPILKKKEIDTPNEADKKILPEKPVRKNLPSKETSSSFLKNITKSVSNQIRHKTTKFIESVSNHDVQMCESETKAQPVIIISAAEAARRKRLEARQSSIEETKVVIDHYTDIVREYGQPKKQPVPILSDIESLKKAAEAQSSVEVHTSNISNSTEETSGEPPDNVDATSKLTNYPQFPERSSPNIFSRSYIDKSHSSEESIDMKLKHALRKIESSDESIPETKVPVRKIQSSEESLPKLKKLKRSTRKMESSEESIDYKSEKRPLKLAATKKKNTSKHYISKDEENVTRQHYYHRTSAPKREIITLDEAEIRVRTTVDYLTDVAMFIVACWLYLFHNALLAVPILILMIYRQLRDEIQKNWPKWLRKPKFL